MDDGGARDALVGGWRLVSWETRAADGQVTHPMGTDPIGYVFYTADGRFSITISRRDRAGFATGDVLGGTTEEKARAVEGFVAYAGRYSFHGDRVIHHVELSLFPNWVGSDQERWVELAGDRLTVSASPLLLAGKQQVPRLVWERVDPPPTTRLTATWHARRITWTANNARSLGSVASTAAAESLNQPPDP